MTTSHKYPLALDCPKENVTLISRDIISLAIAATEDTVLFEVKLDPYERSTDKDFASWAPVEGSENAAEYLKKLYVATVNGY